MARLRVAIIGAGVVGAAAALALARRGSEATLFEQFPAGRRRGSSRGPTRLLRVAYFEDPGYVPLARRSIEHWRGIEAESGRKIFLQTGVLEAGPPDGFLVGGARRAASLHGLSLENLSAREAKSRFPWFAPPKGDECVVEPEAGFLLAEQAVELQLTLAAAHGAALRHDVPVADWRRTAHGFHLQTDDGDYRADRLVFAAGPWTPSLLGEEIAPLRLLSKPLYWTAAGDVRFSHAAGFIPFAVETPGERMFYGFPAIDGDGVKLGEHTGGAPIGSPNERPGCGSDEDREAVIAFLRNFCPGLPAQIDREETCIYEMSPDENFLIGRHPDDAQISIAAGLSGHGFKFAPAIGEALAALANDEGLPAEFGFLDLARVRRGQASTSE